MKSHAPTTVKAGTAMISDGHEFFVFSTNSRLNKQPGVGCQHFMRTFFWVPAGTINRDRPERMVKTVAGTGDFHEVKSGGKGVISARHLTCFCEPCLTGEGECVNEGIVCSFSETTLILAICRTAAAKAKQAAPALSTPATVRSTPATTQGLIDPISRLHRATYRVSWAYLYCNGIPDRSRPCRHHFDGEKESCSRCHWLQRCYSCKRSTICTRKRIPYKFREGCRTPLMGTFIGGILWSEA